MPTRKEVAERLKDELNSIRPGGADLHPRGMGEEKDAPPPALEDLDLPIAVKRALRPLIAAHKDMGESIKEAEKERDAITARIKGLLGDAEVPKAFFSGDARVAYYPQKRTNFSKDIAKQSLLNQGVKPAIVVKAFTEATSVSEIQTLRIAAAAGGEE